jgi:hypothetical protein
MSRVVMRMVAPRLESAPDALSLGPLPNPDRTTARQPLIQVRHGPLARTGNRPEEPLSDSQLLLRHDVAYLTNMIRLDRCDRRDLFDLLVHV